MKTGSEVDRQVLFPAVETQARRRREAAGGADGDPLTPEGSEAEQRYEENGKECGERRKDVAGSRGEDEVVGLSTGWAGRAPCSLEPYEVNREGAGGSRRVRGSPCNWRTLKSCTRVRKRAVKTVWCNGFVSYLRIQSVFLRLYSALKYQCSPHRNLHSYLTVTLSKGFFLALLSFLEE